MEEHIKWCNSWYCLEKSENGNIIASLLFITGLLCLGWPGVKEQHPQFHNTWVKKILFFNLEKLWESIGTKYKYEIL